jgi:ATP-dependent helicase HrpB
MRKASDLRKLDLESILLATLDWTQQTALQKQAPSHFVVPSGSSIRIDYSDPKAPVLPVKLQEMFGATQTPCVLNHQLPLTIHLLSPAGRPLQVTRDLVSFWQSGYPAVRAEMRGRYPKHPWPENPLTALPTRKTNRALRGK